ncbi:hypothetical protein D3C77_457310 [compost metagenome]
MPGATAEPDRIVEPFGSDVDTVVVGGQTQIDIGVAGLEIRQARQQPADGKCAHGSHRQYLPVVPTFETVQGLGDAIKAIAQHRQQGFSLAGQHQAAGQALEQRNLELGFEAFNLMADGGLGHAQFDRCAGETQVPRRGLERPQGIQRQMRPDHQDSIVFLMAAAKYHRLPRTGKAPRLAVPAAARLTTFHAYGTLSDDAP